MVLPSLIDDPIPMELMLVRPEGVPATKQALAFEATCRCLYGAM